jgi:prepilin-type processing-associated H-X9-DG protein
MSRHWIVVASAEHVQRGRTSGFVQACHGKAGPLRRMRPGDGVVCYSPTETFGGKDRLQAFTSIGTIKDDNVYKVDMGGGFHPFRRNVAYLDAHATPITPLLNELDLTRGNRNWGSRFRLGLLPITAADFRRIAEAMRKQG